MGRRSLGHHQSNGLISTQNGTSLDGAGRERQGPLSVVSRKVWRSGQRSRNSDYEPVWRLRLPPALCLARAETSPQPRPNSERSPSKNRRKLRGPFQNSVAGKVRWRICANCGSLPSLSGKTRAGCHLVQIFQVFRERDKR